MDTLVRGQLFFTAALTKFCFLNSCKNSVMFMRVSSYGTFNCIKKKLSPLPGKNLSRRLKDCKIEVDRGSHLMRGKLLLADTWYHIMLCHTQTTTQNVPALLHTLFLWNSICHLEKGQQFGSYLSLKNSKKHLKN